MRRINDIFGANLRILISRNGNNVSETCRTMGINRTQFTKYLSATNWPRPDVLAVICAYFSVDARILLEPLAKIEQPPEVTPCEPAIPSTTLT